MLNPVKELEMRSLKGKRFMIQFNHIIDRNRALQGCPWSFKKNTLILSRVGVNENPMHVDLNWCEFFVHVPNLPLSKMTFDIASLIGNKIEHFRNIEVADSGRVEGTSMPIRVALNVTQLLFCALRICTALGETIVVSFSYEQLQNFYYLCGRSGHISKYNEDQFVEGFIYPWEDTSYGPWLKASLRDGGISVSMSGVGQSGLRLGQNPT
ncbi:UNVERIFIED_CONTAM: hypothetical protein Sradi_6145700 [Sesamum radiatum]|uniref:Zinc knuckle CX2CX4HX4C domain-containing protein n=1 Tax=Sesamum radiatum TaxID=300843 RepID=A0AAW2KLT6_SESRA